MRAAVNITTTTRRRLLTAAAGVAGAGLSAACGKGDATGKSPAAAPATLEFFHEWDGVRTKLVDEMVAGFQAINPRLTIKPFLTRRNLDMDQIFTAMVAGSPPDVVMTTTPTAAVWAHKGGLRWLDDLLKRDRISADQVFYKASLDLCRLNNRPFGLPCLVAGVDPFLMYNRRVFTEFGLDPAKPPKTWQEAEEASAKVTRREGGGLSRIGLVPSQRPFSEWLYLNNGRVFTPDGQKVAFNNADGQETLSWLKDFTERVYGGKAAVDEFYQANRTVDPVRGPRLPWYTGKEAMWATIVSMFFRIDEEEPGFPLGAAQPPFNAKNPRAKNATVANSVWMYGMPQAAKQVEPAWIWFTYITMGEGARKFLLAQKRPSPVRKFTQDRAYRDLNAHWDVVVKNLNAAVAVPQTPAIGDVNKAMSAAMGNALSGKMGVRQALDQAAEQAQTALDQFKT